VKWSRWVSNLLRCCRSVLPEKIGDDACGLARRWVLDPGLARAVVALNRWQEGRFAAAGFRGPSLWIISGHRTTEDQQRINPDAPNSFHTTCPSMAVDLRLGQNDESLTGVQVWSILGGRWKLTTAGRWGGDFCSDTDGSLTFPGICLVGGNSGAVNRLEMNHFDFGVSRGSP